jgi:hypothetical protein
MRALLALCLISGAALGPAFVEPLLTAEEFDALTLGRTMTWSEFGTVYGVEYYLPNRQIRWTVVGDDCKAGHWYPDGDAICFQYEDDPAPDCWEISASGPDFLARYTANPPDAEPVIVTETTERLACFGPKVGA